MGHILEVCVDSVQSAIEAEKGGADRVELCADLVIGGTSPSVALFRQIREYTDLKIRVLLRPRFGDFCYDEYEYAILREETAMYRELGADGIVTGILCPDGSLNLEQMAEIVRLAGGTDVALHRAFDMCADPFETLEQAINLGLCTILTSGQKNSAWEGRDMIRELVRRSAGRIEILAGAGISPDTIEKLYQYTGARAYHMSGKIVRNSAMVYRKEGVHMGIPGFSEYEIWQTDVKNILNAADMLREIDTEK